MIINEHDSKKWLLFADRLKHFLKAHKKPLQLYSNILLVFLFIFSIWHFRKALLSSLQTAIHIEWYIIFLPFLFLLWNAFATRAWSGILTATTSNDAHKRFWSLYFIRIQSQALNLVLPFFGMGGEVLRSLRTVNDHGMENSVLSVTADKSLDIFAELFLAVLGIVFASGYLPYQQPFFISSLILTILCITIIIFIDKMANWIFGNLCAASGKVFFRLISGNKKVINTFRIAFFHHLTEHILMALEIYFVSYLLGIHLGISELLLVNSVSSFFNLLFIFIPGRLGAYECSVAFAFSLLSLSPETGISIALIRRSRQLIVCGLGILLIVMHKKNKQSILPPDHSLQQQLSNTAI